MCMKQDPPNIPEKCCLRCHFLKKWMREENGKEICFELSTEERQCLLVGEKWNTSPVPWSLACHKNVWDSANFRKDSCRDIPVITTQDRGESCFFYPHTPGMFFPAAVVLEERAANRREAERDRALTRRAFWVAFTALIVSILATIVNLIWNVWNHFHPLP